ncbi:ribosome maturation factor RimM [Spiroplasma helicoides]|nr:ribosome maturation factor RimM [Spiroplasma helicoides]
MNLDKQLIKVGSLKTTHGIKGEFKFWMQENYHLVEELANKKIFLKDSKNNIDVKVVERLAMISGKRILKLKDIDDINQAEKFVGMDVYFKIDDNLVEEEISLMNYDVVYENNIIGKVVEELFNGAHDLVKVLKEEKTEFWIPCVDRYVVEYDDDNKKIFVQNIEGLF